MNAVAGPAAHSVALPRQRAFAACSLSDCDTVRMRCQDASFSLGFQSWKSLT